MNCELEKFGRRLACPVSRYGPVTRLEKLRKVAKYIIVGVPVEIRTMHLLIVNKKLYSFGHLFVVNRLYSHDSEHVSSLCSSHQI